MISRENTINRMRRKMLVIGVPMIAVCLSLVENWFPKFIYSTFGYPSGYLASLFLGKPLVFTDTGEVLIPLFSPPIHITHSCSGFGFFCILASAAIPIGYDCFRRSNTLIVLLLPMAVYLITLVTNASRIVCGYHVHCLSRWILPANFQPIIHQAVGVTVFISVLVLLGAIWSRVRCHAPTTHRIMNDEP